MLKKIYDLFMFSLLGFVKVSLFLLLFCFSIFFFLKSKDIAMEEKPALAGLLTEPGITHYSNSGSDYEHLSEPSEEPKIEDMTPEEAEVFLFILRFSDTLTLSNARNLAKVIVEECDNYKNLDPYLILAIIQIESEFSPSAVSHRGAVGLMQVMPRTAEFVAKEMGMSYNGSNSLYDPLINVRLGIHYLSELADRYDTTEKALAAYNYGPTNYEKLLSRSSKPPSYVTKVLKFKSYLEEESIILAKSG